MTDSLTPINLFKHLSDDKLPPVESWDPPFCGDIDICIHKDGQWSYNQSPINRLPLVKLFSKVLRREVDEYFLVTPIEKVKIQVEAEPFVTKDFEFNTTSKELSFITTLDNVIIADSDHEITVTEDEDGQPYPLIHIRDNLHALISRSDYYRLIDIATHEINNDTTICTVESRNCRFVLGRY